MSQTLRGIAVDAQIVYHGRHDRECEIIRELAELHKRADHRAVVRIVGNDGEDVVVDIAE